LALSPADTDGPAKQVIWIPAGKKADKTPSFIETFTRRVQDGYVCEFAIPLSELGPTPSTLSDGAMRVSVTLSDLDGFGPAAVQKRMSLTGTGDFWRSTAGYTVLTQK
jgi:hypothetical protein